jgi:undecaprenyl-diphosphatase
LDKKLTTRLNLSGKDYIFGIFILILGLAAVWSYIKLDELIFSFLCQKPVNWHKNSWVEAFTYLGKTWMLIWLLLIWFLSTGQQRPVLIAFLALIIATVMTSPLKFAVGRPRPREVIKAHSGQEDQTNLTSHLSFPSADAAVAFGVATVVISFVRWPLACLLLAASTGVALLRVTAMKHYPSDVIAGAAMGSFSGWLALKIDQRWLPLERLRFNLSNGVAVLCIIIIPLSFGLFEGIEKFVILLKGYAVPVVGIYLIAKIVTRSKRAKV